MFLRLYFGSLIASIELAKQAKPRLLLLYHYNAQTEHELFNDMASRYSGQFAIGRDLDVY